MIERITDDHLDHIIDYISNSEHSIKILSPFLSEGMVKALYSYAKSGIKVTCITRLYIEDLLARANSINAIKTLMSSGAEVYAVKGLHAKLYLFDDERAILGSANFTISGMNKNLELSLAIENDPLIEDLQGFYDDILNKAKDREGQVSESLITCPPEKLYQGNGIIL